MFGLDVCVYLHYSNSHFREAGNRGAVQARRGCRGYRGYRGCYVRLSRHDIASPSQGEKQHNWHYVVSQTGKNDGSSINPISSTSFRQSFVNRLSYLPPLLLQQWASLLTSQVGGWTHIEGQPLIVGALCTGRLLWNMLPFVLMMASMTVRPYNGIISEWSWKTSVTSGWLPTSAS